VALLCEKGGRRILRRAPAYFSFPSRSHFWRVDSFHHKHDAIYRSQGRTSEKNPSTHSSE
jgi:hypothetical protein